jgi:hypothetical protein
MPDARKRPGCRLASDVYVDRVGALTAFEGFLCHMIVGVDNVTGLPSRSSLLRLLIISRWIWQWLSSAQIMSRRSSLHHGLLRQNPVQNSTRILEGLIRRAADNFGQYGLTVISSRAAMIRIPPSARPSFRSRRGSRTAADGGSRLRASLCRGRS